MYNSYGPGTLLENETRLYDLAFDPGQVKPLCESYRRIAACKPDDRIDLKRDTDAPEEEFVRLGLA